MTSQDVAVFVSCEQNHVDNDGSDGIDAEEMSRSAKSSIENNNTVSTTNADSLYIVDRPTFISTKRLNWKENGSGNAVDVEGESTTVFTISGTPIKADEVNGEHGCSHSANSESTKLQHQEPQVNDKLQGAGGVQMISASVDSARHSLDQILNSSDAGVAVRQEVERTSESIPSPRPMSLSVSKEKFRQQSVSSAPTSPLDFFIDPMTSVHQHSTISPAVTEVLDRSSTTSASFQAAEETVTSQTFRPAESHFVVVAIDFGTTMSGYAFSFVRDPSSIHMMRKWEGGDPGVINQKTPTTLLLNPEGEFHSFGFTARDFYHDLDSKEAKRWLYFEKFKMTLHYVAKLNKETTIAASNGKLYPAMKVFCHALKYFKDHALQELSDQSSTDILNEDIRWVITVPAIWKAPAKQFMRQAAYDAGIASPDRPGQLLIALEPEAASIYVRRLRVHQLCSSDSSISPDSNPHSPFRSDDASPFSPSPSSPFSPAPPQTTDDSPQINHNHNSSENRIEILQTNLKLFDTLPRQQKVGMEINDEGTRYMVVDCGGGTVDITVHEMEAKHGYLHELYKATGGPFGSVAVDLAFEGLLNQIFGTEFIETFKAKRPAGWVDLMIAFESRKRAASPFKNNPLNVSLPFSFIDYYKKTKSSQVESAITKHGDPNIRWSSQGMMRLSPEAMKRLFISTLDRIKQAIGDVLNTVKDVKYLFLVGGFAESPILQHEIRHEFSHILKILIPQDVALTILKGAVCFGLDPTVVTVRRSRLTYGVDVLNRFNPEKHPKGKLVRKDGSDWCTDVFDVFVTSDQPMALGDTVVRKYAPARTGQKTCNFTVYSSEKPDVRFVTDPGVSKCGSLKLYLTDVADGGGASKVREIKALMTFGDTEIKVDAVDVTTGVGVGATIDFLHK